MVFHLYMRKQLILHKDSLLGDTTKVLLSFSASKYKSSALFPQSKFLFFATMANTNECSFQQPQYVTLPNKTELWQQQSFLTCPVSDPTAIPPGVQLPSRLCWRTQSFQHRFKQCSFPSSHIAKDLSYYSLSFSINKADAVAVLLCQSFYPWQNRKASF